MSRFIHYLALLTLFGVSLFPFYIFSRHTEPLQLARWRWIVLLAGAIVALLSGTVLLMCTVANRVGIPHDVRSQHGMVGAPGERVRSRTL